MVRDRVAGLQLALVVASAVAGCGPDGGGGGAGAGSPTTTATGPRRFTNPVLTGSFADPYLLKVGDTWYAYATRDPGTPILRSRAKAAGPCGQAVVRDADGDLWLAYHAWDSAAVGVEAGGQRSMWLDRLSFQNGRPRVEGPTEGPQEAP